MTDESSVKSDEEYESLKKEYELLNEEHELLKQGHILKAYADIKPGEIFYNPKNWLCSRFFMKTDYNEKSVLKIDAAVEHEKVVREVNLIANCN